MILFYVFLGLNLFTFLIIGYDKYLAKRNKRRIPEKTLLSLVFFGGTVGSGLGMLIFRHKTAKRSYLLKFFGIVIFQIVILYTFFIQK
ncbi:DUF1294 domain-containing protein [Flavobacterium acetivorans]|uniref:DUF1294 domain-containing protein n=1 Tax=Flavobacterium acetivorans TaxID=2893883 RepID=UPI001E5F666A|nr:DUF1294 domain-containing protein [Flavobacterium sp. F-29]UFH36245.1 DUF1294 domain-containing protein [Flavobacterium sp. F-29]